MPEEEYINHSAGVLTLEKSGVFGFKAKTSWHYLCTCLAKSKKVHDGVRFVRSHPEVCSFLFFAINNNLLCK